jgi:hypothetical protein
MSLTFVSLVPNDTIWVAYLYLNDGCSGSPFQKAGWWSLTDGSSATVWSGDCAWLNRYWYFYAQSSNGLTWSGPIDVTVTNNAFSQCQWDNTGTSYTAGFQLIDVGINWDYTVTLVGPNYVPPPPPPPGPSVWGDDDDDDGDDDDGDDDDDDDG